MYRVNKNDGTVEPFNPQKVINGIVNAGATPEQAEKIAAEIEAWLPSAAVQELIEVKQIKAKILELLRDVNPDAASSFAAYRKENA